MFLLHRPWYRSLLNVLLVLRHLLLQPTISTRSSRLRLTPTLLQHIFETFPFKAHTTLLRAVSELEFSLPGKIFTLYMDFCLTISRRLVTTNFVTGVSRASYKVFGSFQEALTVYKIVYEAGSVEQI